MKRGAIILLVVLGLGTAMGVYGFLRDRVSPAEWLGKEFSLNEEQSARMVALSAEYGPKCQEMCARITQADSRLAGLIASSSTVTKEIHAALAESDRVSHRVSVEMRVPDLSDWLSSPKCDVACEPND